MSEAISDASVAAIDDFESAQDRARRWSEIKDKHFGMCIWQRRSPSGRAMLEGLTHRATGQILIVETGYGSRLPPENSSKPWPLVEWVQVYAQIDRDSMTWEGLDAALADYK